MPLASAKMQRSRPSGTIETMPFNISGIFGSATIVKPTTVTNLRPTSASVSFSAKAYRPNQTMTEPRTPMAMDQPYNVSTSVSATHRSGVEDRPVPPYTMPHILM